MPAGLGRTPAGSTTNRSSEREPTDSFSDKWNVIGGWFPSLTSPLCEITKATRFISFIGGAFFGAVCALVVFHVIGEPQGQNVLLTAALSPSEGERGSRRQLSGEATFMEGQTVDWSRRLRQAKVEADGGCVSVIDGG
jgi:hypothetical protein